MSDGLLVSEIFGPTWQGEGPSTGRRCGFVRLGLCNLDCQWCDSKYTWDWSRYDRKKELTPMTPQEVVAALSPMRVDRVVVTGGEPLVQKAALAGLVALFSNREWSIEVETNGTIEPTPFLAERVTQWNVSPKLPHSGVDQAKAIKPAALRWFAGQDNAMFKFVAQDPADLAIVVALMETLQVPPGRVWVMPEGTDAATVAARGRLLADMALALGYNMTGRLHIDLWGSERGH